MSLPQNFHQLFDRLQARHKEVSVIASMDDALAKPTRRLVELAMSAGRMALDTDLSVFAGRLSPETRWFETWPGEHYRLLAALVRMLKPRSVVEVGTFTGMGTLALLQELEPTSRWNAKTAEA